MVNEEIWKLVGYVISSKYRRDVLKHLSISPNIPSLIATKLNKQIVHISRAIKELQNKDLVHSLSVKSTTPQVIDAV